MANRCSTVDLDNDLDVRFGRAASNAPASYYVGLTLGAPSDDGLTYAETTGGGYGRAQVANNATSFPPATPGSGAKRLAVAVNLPAATGVWSGYDTVVLFDAAAGGRARAWAAVAASPQLPVGAQVGVPADTLVINAVPKVT